jgi:NADH:ubiquinone oxidoreductase subunit 6 (subunit J)
MSLAIIYVFMTLAILAAIFAIECRRLMFSIIGLIAMNAFIWIMLLYMKATLLAWIQLVVYGGGFTALFVVVVALTEKQKDESFDWKRSVIALSIIAVIMGFAITAIILTDGFTPTGTKIFQDSVTLLWENRVMDLILQAVVFFAASIAIGALFVSHEKKKKLKEEVEA